MHANLCNQCVSHIRKCSKVCEDAALQQVLSSYTFIFTEQQKICRNLRMSQNHKSVFKCKECVGDTCLVSVQWRIATLLKARNGKMELFSLFYLSSCQAHRLQPGWRALAPRGCPLASPSERSKGQSWCLASDGERRVWGHRPTGQRAPGYAWPKGRHSHSAAPQKCRR